MKKIIGLEKGQKPALVVVECQNLIIGSRSLQPQPDKDRILS